MAVLLLPFLTVVVLAAQSSTGEKRSYNNGTVVGKMKSPKYSFVRLVRTDSSEHYIIFDDSKAPSNIGSIDLHIKRFSELEYFYQCTMVLIKRVGKANALRILEMFESHLVDGPESRHDFLVSIYQGKEIVVISDRKDYGATPEAILMGQIAQLQTEVRSAAGRMHTMRGKLTEHAVCDYFRKYGYAAQRANSSFDKIGVDVIAENTESVVYAQVKSGQISSSDIPKLLSNVAELASVGSKRKVAAFAAAELPYEFEINRLKLEEQYKVSIMILTSRSIASALPDYRSILRK